MSQIAKRRDEIVHVDDDRVFPAQVGMQRVQTKYSTAIQVQVPRTLTAVEKRALDEASLLGADGFYAWGQGKDRIEGPSKELAMALVRCYGNCAVDLGEVQETRDAWIFTATFVDLETGFTLARQFRQAKGWLVYGKFDDARKDDIRFQIGQSKAVRNVILNAIPGWLVRRALDKCKGGVREAIEGKIAEIGIEKFVELAIGKLEALGAKEANVMRAMGRKNRASLVLEDLVILAGAKAAIESGQDTVEDLFPDEATPPVAAASKADALIDKLAAKPGRDDAVAARAAKAEKEAKAAKGEPTAEDLAASKANGPPIP